MSAGYRVETSSKEKLISTERIYRTADGEICAEDDPAAAFVVVAVGKEIPAEYVDKVKAFYGGTGPANKSVGQPDEDKADTADEDKANDDAPAKSAPKADWEAYRAAQGFVVDGKTKEQLVDGDELERADAS